MSSAPKTTTQVRHLAEHEQSVADSLATLAHGERDPKRYAYLHGQSLFHAGRADAYRSAHDLITAAVAARSADDPA